MKFNSFTTDDGITINMGMKREDKSEIDFMH